MKTIAFGLCGLPPCVADPAFLPAVSSAYWSATTYAGNPAGERDVDFSDGIAGIDGKANGFYARAVRGGF